MTNINPADIPVTPEPVQPKFALGDQAYSILKALAQIWLPALGSLYAALGAIWGFPAVQQVLATIVAVDTFLGVVLHISSTSYNNSDAPYGGTINVTTDASGKKTYSLDVNSDPSEIDKMDNVNFKVNAPS